LLGSPRAWQRAVMNVMNNIAAVIWSVGMIAGVMGCTGNDAATGDYTERADATNNSNVGGTPEATGLTIGASGSIRIAAQVNDGHFDTEDLDYDAFTFTADADAVGTLSLTGSEADAALELFDAALLDSTQHGSEHATVGMPASIHLLPGVYRLVVRCQNSTPITTSYPYTITIAIGG
jgi:hypothetical protein